MIRTTSSISYLLNLFLSGGSFTEHAVSQGEQYSSKLNCVTYSKQEVVLISVPDSLLTASKAVCQSRRHLVTWARRSCAGKGPWSIGRRPGLSNRTLLASCVLQRYVVGKWLSSVSFFWAGLHLIITCRWKELQGIPCLIAWVWSASMDVTLHCIRYSLK